MARESSSKIFEMFRQYLEQNHFVGADMARKYLQMGYTSARRYANYKGGVKYQKDNNSQLNQRGTGDPEKAAAAQVFYQKYKDAEANPIYRHLKADWKKITDSP
ncbi:DUF4385 family protein [Pedobacter steynii]